MTKLLVAFAAVAVAAIPAPLAAGASSFVLVNRTGSGLVDIRLRRTGSGDWRPIGSTLGAGAKSDVAFSDPDCAFDIQARLAGDGDASWGGVNLCEVSIVTLRRDASGQTWVDYD